MVGEWALRRPVVRGGPIKREVGVEVRREWPMLMGTNTNSRLSGFTM